MWNYWTKKTTKNCWNWLDYYWELLKFVWKLVKGKELRLELTMKTQFASIPDSLTVLLSYSFPPAAASALLSLPDVHFWWEMSICQNVSLLEVSHFWDNSTIWFRFESFYIRFYVAGHQLAWTELADLSRQQPGNTKFLQRNRLKYLKFRYKYCNKYRWEFFDPI